MNRFLFVVVLYRMPLTQAPTLRSLFEQGPLLREHGIQLLVVDNTPGLKPESFSIANETGYVSFGENGGLAKAYQYGYLKAKNDAYDYVVLLDQDSEVSQQFVSALAQITSDQEESVGIWCPRVICCGKCISPYSVGVFAWPDYGLRSGSDHLYGINSFSVMNVRFLEEIGGIEQFYWLDCLDAWLYESAHRTGWAVKQLDVNVNHDLSLVSGRISLDRMKNIAFYESCFTSEHWPLEKIVGTALRLAARGIKRMGVIGGARNYGSYLFEILKGMRTGMKRRKCSVGRSDKQ